MTEKQRIDTVVIGGGLSGLTAAAFLAAGGRSVTLFEKAPRFGGRAVTRCVSGFRFNLGPHALYRGCAAQRALRDLGIEVKGGVPSASGGFAVRRGKKHTLPGGVVSLLSTGLFGLPSKLETARLLAGIARIDSESLNDLTVRQWLERDIRTMEVRELVTALFRLSSYANAPDIMSAGAAVHQLQLALARNVLYLDGGWQTMVDALRARASLDGANLVTDRVESVTREDDGWRVGMAGESLAARHVVLALGPNEAASLLTGPAHETVAQWAGDFVPVRAACLDVGLSRTPKPRALFALGMDRPLYLSVHSAVADLARDGRALIHVARYTECGSDGDPLADQQELEQLLDVMQPGWRDVLEEKSFLPQMTVTHAVVSARAGGLAGRPGPAVPGACGLYVAGDWVGAEGMLADAACASARGAAEAILTDGVAASA